MASKTGRLVVWAGISILVEALLLAAPYAAFADGTDAQGSVPRSAPLAPADALSSFQVLDGFSMELLAAEPMVTDPVAMEYDENGLAYVVEMNDYPYTDKSTDRPNQERTTDAPLGKIRILEDIDGDGVFDKSFIFAQELSWPTGVACWKGGVFVTSTPDLWYLKDTDGDRQADVRRRLYTGFRKFNVQAVINNPRWGLDHRFYAAGSSNGGNVRDPNRPESPSIALSQQDIILDPGSGELAPTSGGARFGNSFDDFGRRFICNIRNPAQHVVLEARYLQRNPYLAVASPLHNVAAAGDNVAVFRRSPTEAWRQARALIWARDQAITYPRSETSAAGYFTSASGLTVYRGSAYPAEYRGNLFVGEVAGNLIHRQTMEALGATFTSRRADDGAEFVASTDPWFRPVNFVNAPDGTLHVLDMYRETIEHPWSIPDDIKAQLDLESGRDRGRIYRLRPPDFAPTVQPKLGHASTEDLVEALAHADGWWRDTAHRLLYERQDKAAAKPLAHLVNSDAAPSAKIAALWTLRGLSALESLELARALADPAPEMREHAVRLVEPLVIAGEDWIERLSHLADDDHARVRFQLALLLGYASDSRATDLLFRIASNSPNDPWVDLAVSTSCAGRAHELFRRLALEVGPQASSKRATTFRSLLEIVARRGDPRELEHVRETLESRSHEAAASWQVEAVIGLARGRQSGARLLDDPAIPSGLKRVVERIVRSAAAAALNDSLEIAARETASQVVHLLPFAQVVETLQRLLAPQQPLELQRAAARALALVPEPEGAELLLSAWATCTPGARGELLEALFARADRLPRLLDAVSDGRVEALDIDVVRRRILFKNADPAIAERARELLAGTTPQARQTLIAAYRDQVLHAAGDLVKGREVFRRECAGCHRLEDHGYDVGPNLRSIVHRLPEELLLSILDPNRELAPNFQQYVLETTSGRSATGLIAAESATAITLRRVQGAEETVLRSDVERISSTGVSLMPEGMEQKVTPSEMSDLVAYLLSDR